MLVVLGLAIKPLSGVKMENNLPLGWNGLDVIPPDEVVDVIDENGIIGMAQPTYYPFELIKKDGDERKPWGLRATPVFYDDGISRWDGGWLIYATMSDINRIGVVVGWRKRKDYEEE